MAHFAPRAVACDNLHLRASAHHWHMSAFCVIENSSEFPITQKRQQTLQSAYRYPLPFIYFSTCFFYIYGPTTGSYGRSQVRRLQLPQTSQEDPGLSGVSSPLRPHHRHVACVHHDQTVSVGDRIAHIMGNHECCQMLTVYDRIGCLKNLRCRLRVEGCRVLV